MISRNGRGRDYRHGVGTSKDLRLSIVQEIIERGGSTETGLVPRCTFAFVANKFQVSATTPSNLWRRFVCTGNVDETPRHTKGRPKVTQPDKETVKSPANKFRFPATTHCNLWKRFKSTGNLDETLRQTKRRPKLTQPDKETVEYLAKESPTITGKEIKDKLERYSPASGTF
jgi:transposase